MLKEAQYIIVFLLKITDKKFGLQYVYTNQAVWTVKVSAIYHTLGCLAAVPLSQLRQLQCGLRIHFVISEIHERLG